MNPPIIIFTTEDGVTDYHSLIGIKDISVSYEGMFFVSITFDSKTDGISDEDVLQFQILPKYDQVTSHVVSFEETSYVEDAKNLASLVIETCLIDFKQFESTVLDGDALLDDIEDSLQKLAEKIAKSHKNYKHWEKHVREVPHAGNLPVISLKL